VTASLALRFPPTSAGQVQAEDTVTPEVHFVLDLLGRDRLVTACADAAIATAGKHLGSELNGDGARVHLAAKSADHFGGERHIDPPGKVAHCARPTESSARLPGATPPIAVAESITLG
jgi:hypothetical protein